MPADPSFPAYLLRAILSAALLLLAGLTAAEERRSICGDSICDRSRGEDCRTCRIDCRCRLGTECRFGRCLAAPRCGDGRCDPRGGESCGSCPRDCGCRFGETCRTGRCVPGCGDGRCDAASGENCFTCLLDCGCASDQTCDGGICIAPPSPDLAVPEPDTEQPP